MKFFLIVRLLVVIVSVTKVVVCATKLHTTASEPRYLITAFTGKNHKDIESLLWWSHNNPQNTVRLLQAALQHPETLRQFEIRILRVTLIDRSVQDIGCMVMRKKSSTTSSTSQDTPCIIIDDWCTNQAQARALLLTCTKLK